MSKKTTIKNLAAGALFVATILSGGISNASEIRPYIGLDYQFMSADFGSIGGDNYSTLYEEEYQAINPNIGVRIGDYFGLEAGYSKSTQENKKFSGTFAGVTGSTDIDISVQTISLDANGYLPVNSDKSFNLIGSVGVGYYEIEESVKVTITGIGSGVASGTTATTAVRLGLGAEYRITDNWGARAMVRYSPISNIQGVDSLTTYNAGISYTF